MKSIISLIGGLSVLVSTFAHGAIISDYAKTDAAAAGWDIVFQAGYNASFNYQAVLDSIADGSRVALASSASDAALTYDLFAATSLATLETFTARNTTVFADDAYWYRNSLSVGFSGASGIYQTSADVGGVPGWGYEALGASDTRLSWHGGSTLVNGGWRSGDNILLNEDNIWQRYILVQSESVPEPSTLLLMLTGLAGIGFAGRKAKKA